MSRTRPISRPPAPLSFSKSVDAAVRGRLPELEGAPVRISFRPALSAARGKLYSKRQQGQPVHAATFIRRREIVLDDELRSKPKELTRILTHELFHFAWVRLSNQARQSYESILLEERRRHARGELGWSAEWRKAALASAQRIVGQAILPAAGFLAGPVLDAMQPSGADDRILSSDAASTSKQADHKRRWSAPLVSPVWRDYVCESFCDTAAWLYGRIRRHDEFTLAERNRRRRAEWFRSTFQNRRIPI